MHSVSTAKCTPTGVHATADVKLRQGIVNGPRATKWFNHHVLHVLLLISACVGLMLIECMIKPQVVTQHPALILSTSPTGQ